MSVGGPVQHTQSFEVAAADVTAALAAGDTPGAVEVLSLGWPAWAPSDGAALRAVLETLPADSWASDARMLTAMGASYRSIASPSRSAALPYLRTADALVAASGTATVDTVADLRIQYAATLRSLGRFAEAAESLESACALLDNDLTLAPATRVASQARAALQQGMVAVHGGDYDLAHDRLRLSLGLGEGILALPEVIECLSALAFVAYTRGEFPAAERYLARVSAAAPAEVIDSQFGALGVIAELLIAVERNHLTAANALAQRVSVASERTDWGPLAHYATAAISIIDGNHVQGLDHLQTALQLSRGWTGPVVVRTLCDGMRATLLMHLGELDEAVAAIERLEPTQNHANCPARFIAGIRFKSGDSAGCLAALEGCKSMRENHSTRTLIDVLLLTAAANYDLGNPVVADVAMDRALLLVSRTQIRTPFTLVPGPTMQRMLARAEDRNQPSVVHAILADLRAGLSGVPYRPTETLSEREKDIAQHLHLDKTLGEIAADLYISTNTVKTHVRSIYRKLEASNRKEAVRRTLELGLVGNITPA